MTHACMHSCDRQWGVCVLCMQDKNRFTKEGVLVMTSTRHRTQRCVQQQSPYKQPAPPCLASSLHSERTHSLSLLPGAAAPCSSSWCVCMGDSC